MREADNRPGPGHPGYVLSPALEAVWAASLVASVCLALFPASLRYRET